MSRIQSWLEFRISKNLETVTNVAPHFSHFSARLNNGIAIMLVCFARFGTFRSMSTKPRAARVDVVVSATAGYPPK